MNEVGPVLMNTPLGRAIVRAIQRSNPEAKIAGRGTYLRVNAPGVCRLVCALVSEEWGAPFVLPGDLEASMPSFKGRMRMEADEVIWQA